MQAGLHVDAPVADLSMNRQSPAVACGPVVAGWPQSPFAASTGPEVIAWRPANTEAAKRNLTTKLRIKDPPVSLQRE
jgi:hypothetical protein